MSRNRRFTNHHLAPNTLLRLPIGLLLSILAAVMLLSLSEQPVQGSSASSNIMPRNPATSTRANGLAQPESSQYYVAPNGSPTGDGSWNNPWDLQTALNQPASVHPGDTIWLRGGTYTGSFTSRLTGTAAAPIIVKSYPGEWAVLDRASVAMDGVQGILYVSGQYAWFWGFEITNSDPNRYSPLPPPDTTINRADGVVVVGDYNKLINLVIHDAGDGIGHWSRMGNSEVYGCIIYNNGWQSTDRGHGHGIYVQNTTNTKQIFDNIFFDGFGYNIHAYGTNANIDYLDIEGNTSFNAAELATVGGGSNILAGGVNLPTKGLTIAHNYTYFPSTRSSDNVKVGWSTSVINQDEAVTDNYIAGGGQAMAAQEAVTMTITGNMEFARTGSNTLTDLTLQPVITDTYRWNNNTYYYGGTGSNQFYYQNTGLSFPGWEGVTDFDLASTYVNSSPPDAVFVRPNQYEPGRANITVYNWSLANSVAVDVSGVLTPGAQYEVRNAEDYLAGPILTGTYTGSPIALPMSGLSVATPVGWTAPPPTGPEFNVFVISTVSSPAATPTPTAFIPPTQRPTQTPTQAPPTATDTPSNQPSSTATSTNTPQPPTAQPSATNTPTPLPTRCRPHFSDVPDGSTFEPYIACLACKRVLAGYADNTFRPNNPVTRSQLAKIVANAANFNDDPGPQLFEDLQPNSPFYDYVQRLARRGYIGGYACGGADEPCTPPANLPYFRPNHTATRGQIAKIIANAAGFNDEPGSQIYQDVPPASSFYPYIQRLSIHDVIGGYPCGGQNEPCGPANRPYNRPSANASRGQISKIVSRTFFPSCTVGTQP